MSVTVQCPSCAGDVRVASPASRTASCPYCQTTLIVNEEAVRALGKMALLAETPSCLAVGWPARCLDYEIQVLGRLQYRYDAGIWEEWWVEFTQDRSHVWISQDEGVYMLEKPLPEGFDVPEYDAVEVGDQLSFGGRQMWVEEKNSAEMVGLQGEIPLDAAPGKPMRYLDLADNKLTATIEYFDDGTHLAFRGKYLKRTDLKSQRPEGFAEKTGAVYGPPALPSPEGRQAKIVKSASGLDPQSVTCPSCGGTVAVRDRAGAAMVVCSYCDSALDVSVPGKAHLLYQARQKERKFPLKIGDTGTLHGVEYVVAGIVVYREDVSDGVYIWTSFQLFNPERGYAFLELENGHWLFFRPLAHKFKHFSPRIAAPRQTFSHLGQTYKVFERSACKVVYVEGELSWVARLGDRNSYMDAIRPPNLISAEWTKQEMEWSLGTYMTPEQVVKAFGLPEDKKTVPRGVAPAQPFTRSKGQKLRARAGLFAAALLLVLMIFAWMNQGTVVLELDNIPSSAYLSEKGFISEPFEIPEGSQVCKLTMESQGVSNSWVGVSVAFLDENETVVLDADAIAEEYHGPGWQEGSQSDYKLMRLSGPKSYRLNVFGQAGRWSGHGGDSPSASGPPVDITLESGVYPARYFLIGVILVAIYPIFEFGRQILFSMRRWPSEEE